MFDIKSDVVKTLIELGVSEKDLFITDNSKQCYHPRKIWIYKFKIRKRTSSCLLWRNTSRNYKKMDFKEPNIYGLEIFLKNIPEPNKKIRKIKKSFQPSDFQKSQRDFCIRN